MAGKNFIGGFARVRIGMHRKVDGDVGREVDEGPDRGKGVAQRRAEILAPVRGQQDGAQVGKIRRRRRLRGGDFQQRVDHGIAGDHDLVSWNVFLAQILSRGRGRGAVQRGGNRDRAAMKFFGKGRVEIGGAQPGLDMDKCKLAIERRDRRRIGRGGVALRENAVGLELARYTCRAGRISWLTRIAGVWQLRRCRIATSGLSSNSASVLSSRSLCWPVVTILHGRPVGFAQICE